MRAFFIVWSKCFWHMFLCLFPNCNCFQYSNIFDNISKKSLYIHLQLKQFPSFPVHRRLLSCEIIDSASYTYDYNHLDLWKFEVTHFPEQAMNYLFLMLSGIFGLMASKLSKQYHWTFIYTHFFWQFYLHFVFKDSFLPTSKITNKHILNVQMFILYLWSTDINYH